MVNPSQPSISLGATGERMNAGESYAEHPAELRWGEPLPVPMEILPERLSEETYIRLRKLEYDHALALTGLYGTLYGAFGAFLTIIVIVLVPAFTTTVVIEHWEIVGLVTAIVASVTSYGAFIFKQALKTSAKAGADG